MGISINSMPIKNNIQKFREEKGLTQSELAAALGVTRTYLYKLESGKYSPGPMLKLKICSFFGKSIREIFYISQGSESKKESI